MIGREAVAQAAGCNGGAGGPEVLCRTVTDPASPERLSNSALPARFAVIRARRSNHGLVHVGDSSVGPGDPGLEPGRALGMRGDPVLDLAEVFVLADVGGDGVEATYGPA